MNRNVSCNSCGKTNQITNIEKYFGKKARIYCLNSACNKEIILDLTNESLNEDKTQLIKADTFFKSTCKLIYKNDSVQEEELKLFNNDNIVGRKSNNELKADLAVQGDPYLSRRQFLIKYRKDGFTISECNGKNKTSLNGRLLNQGEEVYLIDNDTISAGHTTFIFKIS